MKNIIYSIYIENTEPNLSEKHQFTKTQLEKHWQKLIDVKKEYAKHCNADFRVYGNDWGWQAFKKKFEGFEFDTINLYKIHLWEELGKIYDNVLYLDFDVIPNTTKSFFETFDMNKICVHAVDSTPENVWSEKDIKNYKKGKVKFETIISHKDKYDMYVKAVCKKAMLAIDNKLDTNYYIANTAILGGNSNVIKQLRFTERLNELLDTLDKAKKEQLFGEEISKFFFANNEIFVHYLLDKDNIDWFNIPKEWHTYLMAKDKITEDIKDSKMIHLINKRFEELWELI